MCINVSILAINVALCFMGSLTIFARDVKRASDKFEDLEEDFNDTRYVRKNVWDLGFYVLAGFGMLTCKSVINDYVGIVGVTDHGLSYLSGLMGSYAVNLILKRKK